MARKATAEKKAVAKKEAGAIVAGDVTDDVLLEDAEGGDHGFSRGDLVLPFIRILQKLSPQLDNDEPEFIEGAEEGDFLNTATGETLSGEDGIYFVPAVYSINYTEWAPRETKKGLIKDHGSDSSCLEGVERDSKNRMVNNDGNNIVTSGMYFGFLVDIKTGNSQQAIVPMSSTQLKKSRQMNSVIQNFRYEVQTSDGVKRINPRMWFHVFKFTTIPESNDQGKWMGFKVERHSSVLEYAWGHECYKAGKDLADMFARGEVKMRSEDLAGDGEPSSGNSNKSGGDDGETGETIPF